MGTSNPRGFYRKLPVDERRRRKRTMNTSLSFTPNSAFAADSSGGLSRL
ncbi:hypothetical protein GXM18_01700 [Blautia producta ATCC 27340 = DSM 2950]|uniref:Uncharacterized protein n=1 Tax=Blautia producta ATCC 27340 = DSM 2950 TaxID=1121114 RepID=A0ABX6J2M2_9FIRM|nr:hypothetical protein GXM18_01700 [Blautia producta ATCC 27340 = DSM 2950]